MKVAVLSGGERVRVGLACLLGSDQAPELLVADEPTNNLDITSVEVLEAALEEFEGTILTVSHDRFFLDKIVSKILAIESDGTVRMYPGNFSYYYEKRLALYTGVNSL